MLGKQIEKAEKLIWKEIILENIYTKQIKKENLEKFKNRELYLKNWEILELDEWIII
jgi:hypothetical protein